MGLNLITPQHGVSHFDEIFLMFKAQKLPVEGVFTDLDKATSKNLLTLWTDFAKSGDPTPEKSSVQWTKYVIFK